MKKIERLRWVENNFGPQFVLKYFYCVSWEEISRAIDFFEKNNQPWGMRTDMVEGQTQGYHLPFVFNSSKKDARDVWEKNGKKFYYIVSEKQPSIIFCQAVANRFDDECIVVEYRIDPSISQRELYEDQKKLYRVGIGPARYFCWPHGTEFIVRCFSSENVRFLGFDQVYGLMMFNKNVDELVFTVKTDKTIIIW